MAGSRVGQSGAGPTPSRRSARVAGEGAPSVALSYTSTAPRRRTALTNIKTRPSNAYGATGRVGEAQDLAVSATGFTQIFGNQRENAVVRDEEVDVDVANPVVAPIPHPQDDPNAHHDDVSVNENQFNENHINEDQLSDVVYPSDEDESGTPSMGNTSKSFGMVHEAGMLPARGRHAIPGPDNGTFRERWSKYLYAFLIALGILCVGVILGRTLAAKSLVADKSHYNLSMADAFAARTDYTRDIPTDRYGRRIRDPGYLPVFQRTNDLEDAVEAHDQAISEVQLSLASLEELLPGIVTVVKHGDDAYEIPDEFWQALMSKLKSEGLSSEIGSGDAVWLEFLNKNQEKVIQSLSSHVKATGFMTLYKDEFLDLIRTEMASLRDPVRLESLALANLIANSELSLRKVNFFSTGLGARVDPFETSTTFADKDPAAGYQKLFSTHHALPPITALKSWEEPGDCWCAAPDTDGKGLAQLAVQLGHPMIPRQVTVENLPREASLDAEMAPRVMEFWAQTGDEASAAGCGPGPDGWVCLGRFSYNLEAMNHIQTFNLDVIVAKPITKTILRVVENWGGDHTCLYRLRLHGDAGPRK